MPLTRLVIWPNLDRPGIISTLLAQSNGTSLTIRDLRTARFDKPTRKDTRMTKTQASLNDVIRNSKHGFQQMDDRPGKPQKHRYERRKIREMLRSKDLEEGDSS